MPPSAMPSSVAELLNTPIPEKLWHYTSIEGFHGIVTSKRIRATDLRFLNDSEEFIHTRKVASKIIEEAPELDADGFENRELLAKAEVTAFDGSAINSVEMFVACFTRAEDQLGQWRAYSHRSSGVSIAFDLRNYRPPAGSETLVSFAPCVYDAAPQEKLLLDALRHSLEEIRSYRKRIFKKACDLDPAKLTADKETVVDEFLKANPDQKADNSQFIQAVAKTSADCMRIAAFLKNSAFKEEDEWRLALPVLMNPTGPLNNPPRFRFGRTSLIPYIEFPFRDKTPLPIVDVILGPGSDENSLFAAKRLLKLQGLDVKPRLSKVPYRSS
jgi:hypothetical protein